MSLASPLTASMVHTTTVLTSISGGVADNVMPQTARLGFNTRPTTGTSLAEVLAHFRGLVGPARVNATVQLSEAFMTEASGLTSAEGPHFKLLARAIQELWHNTEGSQVGVETSETVIMILARRSSLISLKPSLLEGSSGSQHVLCHCHGTAVTPRMVRRCFKRLNTNGFHGPQAAVVQPAVHQSGKQSCLHPHL